MLAELRTAWREHGPADMLAAIGLRLLMIVEARALPLQERWFDARRTVSTAGFQQLEHGELVTLYRAIHPRSMKTALRHVPGARAAQTFVDYGSGRGRGVLLAYEAGFGNAVGIELERSHHELAVDNVASYERRHRGAAGVITLIHGDVVDFDLPSGPLVLFLYNPFGREVVAAMLDSTVSQLRADPRPTWLVYLQPVHRDVIDASPAFRLVAERDAERGSSQRRTRYAVYEAVLGQQ